MTAFIDLIRYRFDTTLTPHARGARCFALLLAVCASACVGNYGAPSDSESETSEAALRSFESQPELENCAAVVSSVVYSVNEGGAPPQVREQLSDVGAQLLEDTIQNATWQDGFQAIAVTRGDRDLIIGFRGTNSPADFVVDLGIVNDMATPTGGQSIRQMVERARDGGTWTNWVVSVLNTGSFAEATASRVVAALKYYDDTVAKYGAGRRVIITGHSLGGYLAAYVAYYNDVAAITFNSAPGAKYSLFVGADDIEPGRADKILNDRMIGDPVSGPPFALDDQGFPYGHLGRVSDWTPTSDYGIPGIHYMQPFFDHGFAADGRVTREAPTSDFFW